jgi:hypothetical protein
LWAYEDTYEVGDVRVACQVVRVGHWKEFLLQPTGEGRVERIDEHLVQSSVGLGHSAKFLFGYDPLIKFVGSSPLKGLSIEVRKVIELDYPLNGMVTGRRSMRLRSARGTECLELVCNGEFKH